MGNESLQGAKTVSGSKPGMGRPAVVLLSGGIDSTTTLAVAKDQGFVCHAISFDYGQRHKVELDSAKRVARSLGVTDHRIISFDFRSVGGSALTSDIEVPKDRPRSEMSHGIPSTYVPARNTVFLSFALGLAEVVGAFDLFIGVNAVDYSGYPDCRPEYCESFEKLANLATRAGVEGKGPFRIHTPLIRLTKVEILKLGQTLGVDYSLTLSCYDPDPLGLACGRCDSCQIRRDGFTQAGLADPTPYQN